VKMKNLDTAQRKTNLSLRKIIDNSLFSNVIMVLIILNAIVLGMETYPNITSSFGNSLRTIDHLLLWVFVVELFLRFIAYRKDFFREPWMIFDMIVVGIAFMPAHEAFSVLRAARVLRVLRLVSIFPSLRRVIEGLINAIPGIGSIGAILIIIMYVFSVMATKLYGLSFPDWFGSLHASFFSLFQIMTLEGWPDIVRTVMKTYPNAWIFFVIYILVATFSILNLFIAVIVDAMQKRQEFEEIEGVDPLKAIAVELKELNYKIEQLKK